MLALRKYIHVHRWGARGANIGGGVTFFRQECEVHVREEIFAKKKGGKKDKQREKKRTVLELPPPSRSTMNDAHYVLTSYMYLY